MHPLIILVIAVGVVFLLIIRLKFNAFLALIASALLIGLLSPRVPLGEVVGEVTTRFGNLAGRIGIAIAMAALIGQCLMESGAADKVTRRFVAWIGEEYSSLSLVVSGYVLSVPVFHDTVFYLLVPLARAMSVRMKGRYVLFVTSIAAGGSVTHCLVPPTPGPLAMAATLNIDLGVVILVGLVVSVPAALAAWLYCLWIDRRMNLPIREAPGMSLEQLQGIANRPESELPGFWVSLMPIALPVVLISAHTIIDTVAKGSRVAGPAGFLGDPNIALILAAAFSLWLLASHKPSLVPTTRQARRAGSAERRADHSDYLERRRVRRHAGARRRRRGARRIRRVDRGLAGDAGFSGRHTVQVCARLGDRRHDHLGLDHGAADHRLSAALSPGLCPDGDRLGLDGRHVDERQRLLGVPHDDGSDRDRDTQVKSMTLVVLGVAALLTTMLGRGWCRCGPVDRLIG